jgi:pimeloyl-ACP methyl ester carboxylesterase
MTLVVLALAFLVFELVLTRGDTPAIRDSSGSVIPESIAALERLQIGGVEQYVLIRGHDRRNPLLLFLHGGPGMPAMYLAHAFQRELERDFVVVHWDRRGAGKSYAALGPAEIPTMSQTLGDTLELTRHLRQRFGHETIYLAGHSWGSYLGVLAVRERPEYYRAYIGIGQVSADRERTGAIQRQFVLDSAAPAGDDDVIDRVRRDGFVTEEDLFRYGGALRGARNFWPLLWLGLKAPEYTLFDVPNVPRGAQRLGRSMVDDVLDGALDEVALQFEVPVVFFLGRFDFNTPSELAAQYLEKIEAPRKSLVWFDESAHFPFLEEPEKFHAELLRLHTVLESERLPMKVR